MTKQLSRRFLAMAIVVSIYGLAPSAPGQSVGAPAEEIKTVAIHNGDLLVRASTGAFSLLVAGGLPRSVPVWSADGRSIAFVQQTSPETALADLVVVNERGKELSRVHVEPTGAGFSYAGMRFIEEIRWVGAGSIAIRGSINPSQSQYYVFDVRTGKEIRDFIDDASSAAFSSSGQVAYQVGSPHFTKSVGGSPKLYVDGIYVFPKDSRTLDEPLAAPAWSGDGISLATITSELSGTRHNVVIWRSGKIFEHEVRISSNSRIGMYWIGPDLYLTSRTASDSVVHKWHVVDDASMVAEVPPNTAIDPAEAALQLRASLRRSAAALDVSKPDFWCRACLLTRLPRVNK